MTYLKCPICGVTRNLELAAECRICEDSKVYKKLNPVKEAKRQAERKENKIYGKNIKEKNN